MERRGERGIGDRPGRALRAYISGPLQASTDLSAARLLYEEIAAVAAEVGIQPYVPHLSTDPQHAAHVEPIDIYRLDTAALLSSDVVIAHVGAPSTGVGAEIALAANAGVSIIAIARADELVSRFAEGLVEASRGYLLRFDDTPGLRAQLNEALHTWSRHRCV